MQNDNLLDKDSSMVKNGTNLTSLASQSCRQNFFNKGVALIILLAVLLGTFSFWTFGRQKMRARVQEQFDLEAKRIEKHIKDLLKHNEMLLRGGMGLFSASDKVTQKEWQAYVAALQIDKDHPGVQEVGFLKVVPSDEKKEQFQNFGHKSLPEHSIEPNEEYPEYSPANYFQPFEPQDRQSFVYDMSTENITKEAMVRARDSGTAIMTGKITPALNIDDEKQTYFLMYLPVYRPNVTHETIEARRKSLMGYVYSLCKMDDFLQSLKFVRHEYVYLHIFDGNEPRQETLMYTTEAPDGMFPHLGPPHSATRQITFKHAGHNWLLYFESSPFFEKDTDFNTLDAIFALAAIICLLIFAAFMSLTRSRTQTIRLADLSKNLENANKKLAIEIRKREKVAETLRKSEEFARRIVESSNDCIKVMDLEGNLLSMSENGQKLLQIEDIKPYLRTSWGDLWMGSDKKAAIEAFAKARQGEKAVFRGFLPTTKGTSKWWENTVLLIKDHMSQNDRLLVVSRDITETMQIDELQSFLAQTVAGTQHKSFFEPLARYLSESMGIDIVCISRLETSNIYPKFGKFLRSANKPLSSVKT